MRHMNLLITVVTLIIAASFAFAASVIPIETEHDGSSDVAIVFVHGLEGSARDSFTGAGETSWADLIKNDSRIFAQTSTYSREMADADIYLVDYSDVFTNESVEVSIDKMAQQVADQLRVSPAITDHKYVWIVAHSLGGLTVKRILLEWEAAGYDALLSRIVGVSFLGVPSNGSPIAELVSAIGSIPYGDFLVALFGYNSRHIADLKTPMSTNTYLSALETTWANFADRRARKFNGFPRIHCAYETDAELYLGRTLWGRRISVTIVPELYARTTCDGESKPINKTHRQLPKPAGSYDPSHEWLFLSMSDTFRLLQDSRYKIAGASRRGELYREISSLMDSRRYFRDQAGAPLVYESIQVSAEDMRLFQDLALRNLSYIGASWSDVFERIAEFNKCVEVNADEPARTQLILSTANPVRCDASGPNAGLLVCRREDCR